jgi:hypothetical protein
LRLRSRRPNASAIPQAITTPDKVETRLGTLDFKDGAPSAETASKVYDNLDFTHAFDAFQNTLQGVSLQAARKGLQSIGVQDNEIIVYSHLMDAKDIPAEKFWSLTLYDNQTRSMLDTPQRYPRAGSQSYPSPGPNRTPTVQRLYTSVPHNQRVSNGGTGFRRWRRRSCTSC